MIRIGSIQGERNFLIFMLIICRAFNALMSAAE